MAREILQSKIQKMIAKDERQDVIYWYDAHGNIEKQVIPKQNKDPIDRDPKTRLPRKGPPGALVDGPWGSGAYDKNGDLIVTRSSGELLKDLKDLDQAHGCVGKGHGKEFEG